MAIAFVNGSRGGSTASANSIATAAQSLTAGNWTAMAFYIDTVGITPTGVPTDTAGNTYVQKGGTQVLSGGGNVCVYHAFNCLGNASNIVTLPLSGSSPYRAFTRWQFSGVPATDPYVDTKFSTAASGTALSTASISHGSAEVVIVAFGVAFSATGMPSGGAGYTFNGFAITGDAIPYFGDEYHIVSADEAPTMTSSSSVAWALFGLSAGTPATVSRNSRMSLVGVR